MSAPIGIKTADLFCGGGGWTEGLKLAAASLNLDIKKHICVNHWGPAINTHSSNHPYASHVCDKLNKIDPAKYGQLDAVIASPECTHFSNARGAAPVNDQKRIPAGSVPGWILKCKPAFFCIENVREFEQWGEMDENGKPKKDGKLFQQNVVAPLKALGYSVEWKVLNCADYGDPTTRQRLFILGRRDGKPVEWPEPSHSKGGANELHPWIPAKNIIDWTIKSKSIFNRKKPLAVNTIKRIEAGIRKFWGPWAEPFLVVLKGGTAAHRNASAKSLDDPVPAICANGLHMGIVEPLLIGQQSGGAARPTSNPLMTASAKGAIGLTEPFLVKYHGARSENDDRTHGVDEPVKTLDCSNRYALCEPVILQNEQGGQEYSSDRPMPTITANSRAFSVIEPFMTIARGQSKVRGIDGPAPTLTTGQHLNLCEPFIVEYYTNSEGGKDVDQPLPTVTCRDRFGVVQQFGLDIHYRMLQPHELAAAMGFPKDYLWYGNKTQIVRQIGNAVPVNTAKAILHSMLKQTILDGTT